MILEFLLSLLFLAPAPVMAANAEVSQIPIQVPVSDPYYERFRAKAAEAIDDNMSHCAKFFNRMMAQRFGVTTFGSAWTLQDKKENKTFLDDVWQLSDSEFKRDEDFRLHSVEARVDHYRKLYEILDNEAYPIGVLGFMYKYSFYKQTLLDFPQFRPQSHVSFLAGKKVFEIKNNTDTAQTVQSLLEAEHGGIHDFEQDFVNTRVPLDQVLQPGEVVHYDDYLVEEQFRTLMNGSLLEVFLRKHRNNRVTPLLRPVSYSRISQSIISEIKLQESLFEDLGTISFVSGAEFEAMEMQNKAAWKADLRTRFAYLDRDDWSRILVVPIPQYTFVLSLNEFLN